jgi:uncharacterized protein
MRLALLVVVVLLAVPAQAQETKRVTFGSAQVCIQTASAAILVPVEVARTEAQRAQGLMDRDRLAPNAGMLFIFSSLQPPQSAFWMYRTRIPLDIAFLGRQGEIVSIKTMQPCKSVNALQCPTHAAGAEFAAALEVNHGFFKAKGVRVGDRVLPAEQGRCPAASRP